MTQSLRVDLSNWAFGFGFSASSLTDVALQVGLSASPLTDVALQVGLSASPLTDGCVYLPARRFDAKVRNSLCIHQIRFTLTYFLG